jgi:hypothetical protein
MTQKTKLYLMYGGGIVLASVIFSYFYTKNRVKSKIEANEVPSDSVDTTTPAPSTSNPFTAYVNNPLPTSIDFKPSNLSTLFKSDVL